MNDKLRVCLGVLELPKDKWVPCDQQAGHLGKHSGAHNGRRYWWTALHARARRLVPRAAVPPGRRFG